MVQSQSSSSAGSNQTGNPKPGDAGPAKPAGAPVSPDDFPTVIGTTPPEKRTPVPPAPPPPDRK